MADDGFVAVFSSENRANIAVYPLDVFVLTDAGTAQIRGGAAELSAGARASAGLEAESGAPQLERSGYYVSIARRAVKAKIPHGGAKWKELVVEDDPDMSELVSRLLIAAGFEVETAANRDQVLAGLRKQPLPDLVILDVMLPDVNGFDILQRLKAHPALKAVPVIMLTADAARESVMRGIAGGADGYITKPFERAMLLEGVKAVLGIDAGRG
ncbi:MAG: response regulator [Betaproteobacteria bacterium]